ncbi:MAG: restriction endonuclease subunit R, partial [Rikenellaceae bacterium]
TDGEMNKIDSKEQLKKGEAFKVSDKDAEKVDVHANSSVKYDIIGKLTESTGLTRKSIVEILTGIEPIVFDQFAYNPEEFIIGAAELINEQKASIVIQKITYNKLEESYDSSIFTEPKLKGKMGVNVMSAERHLYDHVLYDSKGEKDFAEELETHKKDIAVYVKLPKTFFISTPVGKYSPDWAIAFEEGSVKHIYFVAETKGGGDSLMFIREKHLRGVEDAKILCAEQHFKTISSDVVKYDVVRTYEDLLKIVAD